MSELVEFLRARLARDEQIARAATPGPWRWDIRNEGSMDEQPELVSTTAPTETSILLTAAGEFDAGFVCVDSPDREHIARHDPARVLAEVDAKRRIIDEHMPTPVDAVAWEDDQAAPFGCRTCAFSSEEGVRGWGYCLTLRLLALLYASHKDYREEWRP